MAEIYSFKETMDKKQKEVYEKACTNGFVGSNEEWLKFQLKEEKESEESVDSKLFRIQSYENPLLPLNWQLKTFDKMETKQDSRLEMVVSILKRQTLTDSGVWLSGGVGCGKTHILLSIFNDLSHQYLTKYGKIDRQVKYFNYSDLCSILRQDPNNFERFHMIRSPKILFIDDIGVSKSTDFIQEKIYSLVNYRVEQSLPTFVSTNLKLAEIQAEFNDRMVSRIKESSAWVDLSGVKDYRTNFISDNMKRFKEIIK